jgi:hypothetical protein
VCHAVSSDLGVQVKDLAATTLYEPGADSRKCSVLTPPPKTSAPPSGIGCPRPGMPGASTKTSGHIYPVLSIRGDWWRTVWPEQKFRVRSDHSTISGAKTNGYFNCLTNGHRRTLRMSPLNSEITKRLHPRRWRVWGISRRVRPRRGTPDGRSFARVGSATKDLRSQVRMSRILPDTNQLIGVAQSVEHRP